MDRAIAGKALHVASIAAALTVAWQGVRYIMGDIGNVIAPVWEFVAHVLREGAGMPPDAGSHNPLSELLSGFVFIVKSFAGFAVWLLAAMVVGNLLGDTARVVEIGWDQFRAERREIREAAKIEHDRQMAKDRRRELRRKVLDARKPHSNSSGFFLFLLGLLIGAFFF